MRKGNLLIKGGKLFDPARGYQGEQKDILIKEGKFVRIADAIEEEQGVQTLYLKGEYVSPGFIDIHTHVYSGASRLALCADEIGVAQGVTTVVDAGSAGPGNIADFIERDIKKSRTRVYAAMHYATDGLIAPPEADSPDKYDLQKGIDAYQKNKDYIVAVKARASQSCVGELGIVSIKAGYDLARAVGVPMLVHIGHMPPAIEDVLKLLDKGDLITHAFHGKDNNLFFDGKIKPETEEARKRGVLFDVGHGKDSFNFDTGRLAKSLEFYPDTISTDLHCKSWRTPVQSLCVTMDKFLALGYSLEFVVDRVTDKPARYLHLDYLGRLEEGAWGDVTIYTVEDKKNIFLDANKNEIEGRQAVTVRYAVVGGKIEMDTESIIRKFCRNLEIPELDIPRYECGTIKTVKFLEEQGVFFDDEKMPVFVNHMISVMNRMEKNELVEELDETVVKEIPQKSMDLAEQVLDLMQKYGNANRAEQALVAIHIHTALETQEKGE